MASYYNADPESKSTGKNTQLFVVEVAQGDGPQLLEIEHGLGIVPSWVRVTRTGYDDGDENLVLPKPEVVPLVDETATSSDNGIVWDSNPSSGAEIDLSQSLYFIVAGDAMSGDGQVLVEIGRTHSVPK